jgi:hypothetical protein
MALGIKDNIYKRNKLSKLVHFFSFFTPSEHAVTVKEGARLRRNYQPLKVQK